MSCYKLRKNECILSDSCEWIVGKGCVKKISRTIKRTPKRTIKRTSKRTIKRKSKRTIKIMPKSNLYYLDTRHPYSPEEKTIDDFTLTKKLGTGGEAVVYKVNNTNGDIYAIKLGQKINYNSPRFKKLPYKYKRYFSLNSLQTEYMVLKHLITCDPSNIYIPKIYQSSMDNTKKYFYYIIEYFNKGSLENYVGKLSQQTIFGIIARLIICLMSIHKCGYLHLDIKPDNIMVSDDPIVGISLCDYGMARKLDPKYIWKRHQTMMSFIGTVQYMTTNFIKGNPLDEKDDYEQLGITAIKLFTGTLPWANDDFKTIKKIINDKNFPNKMSIYCGVPFMETFLTSVRNLKLNPPPTKGIPRIVNTTQYENLL